MCKWYEKETKKLLAWDDDVLRQELLLEWYYDVTCLKCGRVYNPTDTYKHASDNKWKCPDPQCGGYGTKKGEL